MEIESDSEVEFVEEVEANETRMCRVVYCEDNEARPPRPQPPRPGQHCSDLDETMSPLVAAQLPVAIIVPDYMAAVNSGGITILQFAVHWTRAISSLSQLRPDIQTSLIGSAWSDLFIVSFAEYSHSSVSAEHLMRSSQFRYGSKVEKALGPGKGSKLDELISKFTMICFTLQQFNLDTYEYEALKLLALTSSDRVAEFGPDTITIVNSFHKAVLDQLHKYSIPVGVPNPIGAMIRQQLGRRILDVLLLLPMLRTINAKAIEAIFFRNLKKGSMEALINSYASMPVQEAAMCFRTLLEHEHQCRKNARTQRQ